NGVDSILKISYVQVYALPDADFSSGDTVGCAPLTAKLNDLSKPNSGTTTGWEWSFGDGGTSIASNPTYTYTRTGTYDVALKVTNSFGCSKILSKAAYISTQPVKVNILNAPGGGCVPYTYTPDYVVNRGDPITSYLWIFGDGTTSTLSKPSHTYTATGAYTLKLFYTTTSGCKDSLIFDKGIAVGRNFDVDFTLDPSITCGKQKVFFTSKTELPVTSYTWSFGDSTKSIEASPVHRYTDAGYYSVSLTVDKDGCKTTAMKKNIIYVDGTIARFDYTKDCKVKGRIIFKNTSINGSGYSWDFGDNTVSTDTNTEHTFTKDGDYQVRLISSQNDGCKDTQVVVVPVWFGDIDVTAYQDTICKGEGAVYTLVHPRTEFVDIVRWDFGRGMNAESNAKIVRHLYPNVGEYDLEVISTDVYGCKDTVTKTNFIRVNGPTADFDSEPFNGCRNTEVTFKNLATGDGLNRIKKWVWNFGDGKHQEYTQQPFKHSYDSAGSFDVTLKVTDVSGCSDSLTKNGFILVSEGKADFITLDSFTCNGNTVNFRDLSSGSIDSHLWNFGDGKTATIPAPTHSYADTGVYTVKLIITSSSGCVDSLIKQEYVTVRNPKAKFGFSDQGVACAPRKISFYDSSYYAKSWSWDFGEGTTSTLQNPSHEFVTPAIYRVKLTVTSIGGCQSTFSTDLKVSGPQGNLTYSPTSGCENNNRVTYKAAGSGFTEFTWDFGDGTIINSGDSIINHSYKNSGNFIPKVIFKNASGCFLDMTGKDTINIKGVTANYFSDNKTICLNDAVQFKDSSTTNTATLSYKWDFGDGQTSSAKNPSHKYLTAGNFDVKLVVNTQSGCTDSITKSNYVKVVKAPLPAIVSEAEGCEAASIAFASQLASDTSSIISWLWNFGNGQTSSLKNPPPQVFTKAGSYTNSLTVVNSTGCSNKVTNTITIHPVPQIFNRDTTICKGDNVQLFTSGATNYSWSPSNNLSCTTCNNPVASPVSDQTYRVNAASGLRCINEDSVTIKVLQPFNVSVAIPEDSICIGETIQLQASGTQNYLWTPSSTLSANNIANPKAKPSNDITYTVIGYDSLGCFRDTATVAIKAYEYPSVELGADIVLAAGNTKALTPLYTGRINSYLWTPSKDLSCYTCPSPVLSARDNVTYRLKVSNEGGCTAEDLLNVIVTCDNSIVFIPNTFSPNGDGMNDVFYPRGNGINSISSMRILNHWGELVFSRKDVAPNNPSTGWDGMYKGGRADAGVYTYAIEIVCKNSQLLKFIGNITLIQ
ncbi:MAG TPA: PKD domain-containing protein, partial [Segetibacter sp.]